MNHLEQRGGEGQRRQNAEHLQRVPGAGQGGGLDGKPVHRRPDRRRQGSQAEDGGGGLLLGDKDAADPENHIPHAADQQRHAPDHGKFVRHKQQSAGAGLQHGGGGEQHGHAQRGFALKDGHRAGGRPPGQHKQHRDGRSSNQIPVPGLAHQGKACCRVGQVQQIHHAQCPQKQAETHRHHGCRPFVHGQKSPQDVPCARHGPQRMPGRPCKSWDRHNPRPGRIGIVRGTGPACLCGKQNRILIYFSRTAGKLQGRPPEVPP